MTPKDNPVVEQLLADAVELRRRAETLESAALVLKTMFSSPVQLAPAALGQVPPLAEPAAPATTRKKGPVRVATGKLRAPRSADEPRKLVGRAPFAAGVLTQTCETNRQRLELLASLKEQGLVRAEGRLQPGTYDVVWKDGAAVVYWKVAA